MAVTIDASVVGASMFEETLTPNADAIFGSGDDFIAPSIIEAEILSAATKRVRVLGVPIEYARERWRHGISLPVRRIALNRYTDHAFTLSAALRHPAYDCLYLAVAILEDAPLVTGDRRLYDRAVEFGLRAHVRWLGDCG